MEVSERMWERKHGQAAVWSEWKEGKKEGKLLSASFEFSNQTQGNWELDGNHKSNFVSNLATRYYITYLCICRYLRLLAC